MNDKQLAVLYIIYSSSGTKSIDYLREKYAVVNNNPDRPQGILDNRNMRRLVEYCALCGVKL